MRDGRAFTPFSSRGRRKIAAILVTFALFSALSVALSIRTTSRSQHRAAVLEVAARQRTLAERYVKEVLLVPAGDAADPGTPRRCWPTALTRSSTAARRRRCPATTTTTTLPAQHGTSIARSARAGAPARRTTSPHVGSAFLASRPSPPFRSPQAST